MRLVNIGDCSLACEVRGPADSDEPPLLLVHAYPLNHRLWRKQVEPFSDGSLGRRRVIVPDLRGFGESGVQSGPVAMGQYADDLAALLDALGVSGPVAYVGVSMAGYVGWQFLKRHPARVDRMLLCCTKAASDEPEFAEKRRAVARKVLDRGSEAIRATPQTLLGATTRRERPELIDELEQWILATDPNGIAAAQLGMADREDVRDWLPSVTVPTHFVAGAEDTFSPPDEMRPWVDTIPETEFTIIEGAGHLPMLERPHEFNAVLESFL